ncbi:hypothetical protein EDC56_0607 [Sinobacterium caligoides]|uniref:Uncharacterized protein n=1 Tax=Sinobacterium caligoides TaxID=933926 RepID=A0A3N2DZ03_9GAMM|nr:hypothetical protein [Sinobacterium caligoides]ROS05083.1 hypothetical protein EDC56_0607 [Sinobacterium caligoides]
MFFEKKCSYNVLVGFSLCIYVFWFFWPYIGVNYYSSSQLDLMFLNGTGGVLPVDYYLDYLVLFFYVVSSLGLLFRKNWARLVFVSLLLADVILSPLSGAMVLLGVDKVIHTVLMLIDGCILALTFLSSVKDEFGKKGG